MNKESCNHTTCPWHSTWFSGSCAHGENYHKCNIYKRWQDGEASKSEEQGPRGDETDRVPGEEEATET